LTASLDSWLPEHHVRTFHTRASHVTPERLWAAANETRVRDTRTLRPLIAMRLPGHGPGAETTFRELFRTGIFTLLEEGERHSISGVAGRLWTPTGHYARFETGADYKEYAERGTAKVALMTSVREHERGSEIVAESRVWCVDRRAQLRFRPYWALVGPFTRFIRLELLAAVTSRAESGRAP
jgi:hypothetical protein